MLQDSDSTGGERSPIHDGCIHFVCASACKNRPPAGVEMRIVLQHAHGRFRSIEAGSPALENFVTSLKRTFESCAVFALFFRRHVAALNGSGTAVDHQSKFLCFHVWLILRSLFRCNCYRPGRFFGRRPEGFWDCTKEHETKEA